MGTNNMDVSKNNKTFVYSITELVIHLLYF